MKVDLSQVEVDMINEALDCWEKSGAERAFSEGLIGAMLAPKGEREDIMKSKVDAAMEADKTRKRRSILLRAKLIQADNKLSEFPVETVPAPLAQ